MKKLFAILLAAVMLFALAACNTTPSGNSSTEPATSVEDSKTESTESTGEESQVEEDNSIKGLIPVKDSSAGESTGSITVNPDYSLIDAVEGDEQFDAYKAVLGDYYAAVLAANQATDTAARYALMAIAEAKMLEAGIFLPTTTQGGNYAITRIAPKCVSAALWGNDNNRSTKLIITNELMKAADRDALNKLFAENKGTGKYLEKAKAYLEEKGYTFKDTYATSYSSEPQTWDLLATYRSADSEAIINTQDNLVEYDNEGRLCQALATFIEVSEDGLEYTFTLREGVKWVTSAGEVYADLTANDFVAGLKHLLDAQGGLETLTFGIIKNAAEYVGGEVTDFAEVGVEAVDDLTVKYTLAAKCPYFITMLTYNLFAPMNQEYFEAKGEDYGTSPDNILYCGPYLVTNHTENNKIVFSLNDNYYAKDEVTIKEITWFYNDGSDVLKAYNDMKAGTIDGAGLNSTALEKAKEDGLFDDYSYVSATNAVTYGAFMNVARQAYSTEGHDEITSPKTDAQKELTKAAMANQDFRLALCQGYDRVTDNALSVGEELALASIRNSYTPGTYVFLDREVIIPINGENVTFPAGTYYGAIMQAQIDADGYKFKVWDPTLDGGAGSSDTFDGWYNKENAVESLNKAIEALAAQGYEVSESNPITIDYIVYEASAIRKARGAALKQGYEELFGGKVIVNLIPTTDIYSLYYAGYYCDYGSLCNYDMYDVSGWGPDYGDPATYLNTMLPLYKGDMTHCIGLY